MMHGNTKIKKKVIWDVFCTNTETKSATFYKSLKATHTFVFPVRSAFMNC
jgi:biotin synthase-like enzyme